MSELVELLPPSLSADEALRIYEDSLSYYMPEDVLPGAASDELTGPVVPYYEAA